MKLHLDETMLKAITYLIKKELQMRAQYLTLEKKQSLQIITLMTDHGFAPAKSMSGI